MFILDGEDFVTIINSVENKKVIVYGSGLLAKEAIRKLNCLDIPVAYCIDDDLSAIDVQVKVKDVYSLLLEEEEFYVLLAKEDEKKCAKILEGMGLQFYQDFNSVKRAKILHPFEDDLLLDATLGYTMPYKDTSGKGIRIFGDINKAEFIIAILGGSTSDPCYYQWKCWGECLWEKNSEKWAVIVGAVVGYSSSDEVQKLLRDILPLRPNLFINYSGVNDPFRNRQYVNNYQGQVYERVKLLKPRDMWRNSEMGDKVCYGVQGIMSAAEGWISNQRIMHAIANEFGVKHMTYLQPSLYTKRRGEKDEEIFAYSETFRNPSTATEFISKVKEMVKKDRLDFIVDATDWFDEYDGLFFDAAHVQEEGNRLIAEKVHMDIIKNLL